jgi:DMSO/TMAO reductase YedYZ molybdopterin-dependent catalytic subunit
MRTSLPPGQRSTPNFPRFGLTQFMRRFPKQVSRVEIEIAGRVENSLQLSDALAGLPRVDQVSDFHCVTTWTCRSLRWSGVRFVDFYERTIAPQARPVRDATLVALRGQDGARTGMLLADLLAPDVLLADSLNGQPLTVAHGAPVRLVAPAHYGYKSIKYLSRIEFKLADEDYAVSGPRFMDHPRARVALEERGRVAPGWLLRHLYRPLVRGTAARFAEALAEFERQRPGVESSAAK